MIQGRPPPPRRNRPPRKRSTSTRRRRGFPLRSFLAAVFKANVRAVSAVWRDTLEIVGGVCLVTATYLFAGVELALVVAALLLIVAANFLGGRTVTNEETTTDADTF